MCVGEGARDYWRVRRPALLLTDASHTAPPMASSSLSDFAKELDMQGHGIPVTVANTTYMGMNALHSACCLGKLLVYQ